MNSEVSVIIVTFNRPKDVNETVNSLLNQTVKPLEIIVIDDGSGAPINLKFRDKALKLIRFDREIGLSAARNYGIRIAKGKYIAFIDDDAIAGKCWIQEVQQGISIGDIIGGPIKPLYLAPPPKWWNEDDFGGYAGVCNWKDPQIWGANMVVKKEVFRAIGLFNTALGRKKGKLLGYEEIEFFARAKRRGFKVQFVPSAIVYHKVPPERMTLAYIIKWNYNAGKSLKIFEGFHPLRACFDILFCLLEMISIRTILSQKLRIKKIAFMTLLLGKLM
jgi:glycosyltransferase involved in cell wall biosynthesis